MWHRDHADEIEPREIVVYDPADANKVVSFRKEAEAPPGQAPLPGARKPEAGARGGGAAPTGSVDASAAPANVELRELFASVELPPGLVLARTGAADVTTRSWPAKNMSFRGARVEFADRSIRVQLEDGGGSGWFDVRDTARGELVAMIKSAFVGSPAAEDGYDPMRDPDPIGTARRILDRIRADAGSGPGGGGGVRPDSLIASASGRHVPLDPIVRGRRRKWTPQTYSPS